MQIYIVICETASGFIKREAVMAKTPCAAMREVMRVTKAKKVSVQSRPKYVL